MIYQTPSGLTVKQLKHILLEWPEYDHNGNETMVWVGDDLNASLCIEVSELGGGDLLIVPSYAIEKA